jgi:hypothetical protein
MAGGEAEPPSFFTQFKATNRGASVVWFCAGRVAVVVISFFLTWRSISDDLKKLINSGRSGNKRTSIVSTWVRSTNTLEEADGQFSNVLTLALFSVAGRLAKGFSRVSGPECSGTMQS